MRVPDDDLIACPPGSLYRWRRRRRDQAPGHDLEDALVPVLGLQHTVRKNVAIPTSDTHATAAASVAVAAMFPVVFLARLLLLP